MKRITKKITITLCLLIVVPSLVSKSYAQNVPCGFDSMQQVFLEADTIGHYGIHNTHQVRVNLFRQKHPGVNHLPTEFEPTPPTGPSCEKAIYQIPVVVHVIHGPSDTAIGDSTNITMDQIDNQISVLNENFRNATGLGNSAVNTGIQFCLATRKPDSTLFDGVTRTSSGFTDTKLTVEGFKNLMGLVQYDPDRYLNIYVIRDFLDAQGDPSQVIGYGIGPGQRIAGYDGVVVTFNRFGDYSVTGTPLSILSEGNTLTHEVGHYFGLYHPFEGGGCAGINANDCDTKGDLCCDVPAQDKERYGCASTNTCNETYDNDPLDQIENFMAYSDEDCKNTFTKDQADIMYSTLLSVRSALWQPSNLSMVKAECCILAPNFEGVNSFCNGDSTEITATKYEGTTYVWKLYDTSSLKKTQTDTIELFNTGGLDSGSYDLELTLIKGSDTVSRYQDDFITVFDCTKPLKSVKGNWYFGKRAGITFYANSVQRDINPSIIVAPQNKFQINTVEGTLSRSTSDGQLQFYAGAHQVGVQSRLYVHDRNYLLMDGLDSSGLNGFFSASQGMAIVPFYSDTNKYYLFHFDQRLKYSIIDMSANSGDGKVITKDVVVPKNDSISNVKTVEAMTVVPKCNDRDHWLIHESNDPVGASKIGINILSVTDSTITYDTTYVIDSRLHNSRLKFAPNGQYFAYQNSVYSFDRKTASIDLEFTDNDPAIDISWDAAFSPNSRVLYTYVGDKSPQSVDYKTYQYNLDSKEPVLTRKLVSENHLFSRQFQLGPDDKIYMAAENVNFLSEIEFPNKVNVGNANECGYKMEGVELRKYGVGGISQGSLPNFIDALYPSEIETNIIHVSSSCKSLDLSTSKCCAESYKWFFGDGDSSLLKSVEHQYQDTGFYTITLIVNQDTVQTQIHIGEISPIEIFGATEVCDTSIILNYSVVPTGNYDHTWSADSFTTFSSINDKAFVQWSGAGWLQVISTNLDNGCIDTGKVQISRFEVTEDTDSIWSSDSFYCSFAEIDTLFGNDYPANNTYTWFSRTTQGAWTAISNSNSHYLVPIQSDSSTEYYREAIYDDGCSKSISNVITVEIVSPPNNTVSPNYPSAGDCEYGANGSVVSMPLSYVSSQWQSLDEYNEWQDIDNDTNQNLRLTPYPKASLVSMRRIVKYNSCQDTSLATNVGIPQIKTHPSDENICIDGLNGTDVNFSASMTLTGSSTIRAIWERKSFGQGSWSTVVDSTYTTSDEEVNMTWHQTASTEGDSFRVQIIILNDGTWGSGCYDTLYSGAAILGASVFGPQIITHPSNQTVASGNSATFNVVAWYTEGAEYKWEVQGPTGGFWAPVKNSNSSTLSFNPAEDCQDWNLYRAIVTNQCAADTSNSARLLITGNSSPAGDLWMRDSYKDIGDEPNDSVSNQDFDLFSSPDLWNCSDSSNCSIPEDAEYKIQTPNYVRVKVRNKGTETADPAQLRLYWTLASTGEIWDESWIASDNNRFFNLDSSDGTYYPMGGEITADSIIQVDTLPSGDSIVYTYEWSPPNPKWYYVRKNRVNHYSDYVSICLLARIEHCDAYPFGMAQPELFDVNIAKNVQENNNIVTRNFASFNDNPDDEPIGPLWVGTGRISDGPTLTIHFNTDDPSNFDDWEVVAHLDDTLRHFWFEADTPGLSYQIVDSNTVKVLDQNFELSGMAMTNEILGHIGFSFEPKTGYSNLPQKEFNFAVSQSQNGVSDIEGAFIFNLDNSTGSMSAGSSPNNDLTNTDDLRQDQVREVAKWEIHPNPSHDKLDVDFELLTNRGVEIEIVDLLGRTVKKRPASLYERGNHTVTFDVSDLAKAVYIVNFKYDHYIETRRLLID